jgi:putative oxidoreductase
MMATTETLRSVLRTSRGQPILKLQSAEQRASLALDLLSLGSRAALGVSFLLSVSDRLGFYGNPGERGVSWGTFERFLGYAAKVNAFAPAWMIPFLGTAATVLELLFGVTLVLGLALRWAAFGSAGLLFLFGSAMARGRRWLNELVENANANVESIAKRERCSVRHVNMTISLAFLAPALVTAVIEGR